MTAHPAPSVSVVTGAAGGIGAALAAESLSRGSAVALSDLDAAGLRKVEEQLAEQFPGRVLAVAADASSADDLARLVDRAEDEFGPVDAFFANAGVFRGFGLDAAEADWDLAWQVNVQSQVRAAQLMVPRWLERGGGSLVAVASAAGLLTQLGSPVYSATKHASVGFATWLAATYGDRGVRVTCLCPMGVATDMLATGEASDDPEVRLALTSVVTAGEVLTPSAVAQSCLDAVEAGTFLCLPHRDVAAFAAFARTDPDAWLTGMQQHRRRSAG